MDVAVFAVSMDRSVDLSVVVRLALITLNGGSGGSGSLVLRERPHKGKPALSNEAREIAEDPSQSHMHCCYHYYGAIITIIIIIIIITIIIIIIIIISIIIITIIMCVIVCYYCCCLILVVPAQSEEQHGALRRHALRGSNYTYRKSYYAIVWYSITQYNIV